MCTMFRMIYALCIILMLMLTQRPLRPPLSLSHPLQYTTDDLDYSQFYDYSEGATDIVPTDEYSEPQVNGKGNVSLCDLVCVSQCCVLHAHRFSGKESVKKCFIRRLKINNN